MSKEDEWEIPEALRQRVQARRREWNSMVMRFQEFPRIANPAHTRLERLIKQRKAEGRWPPRGDEVDTDQELMDVLDEVHDELIQVNLKGPLFKAVVNKANAKRYTEGVLARVQRQRERDLIVRRRLLKDRCAKRGI